VGAQHQVWAPPRYRWVVHPLEYLRAVSRHRRIPAVELAVEFSRAVGEWGFDGPELVLAARRMLEHRPDAAPLWWATARLVTAPSVIDRAFENISLLDGADEVDPEGSDRHDDGLVIPVFATAGGLAVITSPWTDRLDDALIVDRPVTLICGIGHRVHPTFLPRVVAGVSDRGEVVREIDLAAFHHRLEGPDCPAAPELLRVSAV